MITTDPAQFLRIARRQARQTDALPRGVFLVGADFFEVGFQSLIDNRYMTVDEGADPRLARSQACDLARAIAELGIPTTVFPGMPGVPDAVFPNNVFGSSRRNFLIGAMRHPERRVESNRRDIRAFFTTLLGKRSVDLSAQSLVAELTGTLIIDRAAGLGFCGMTDRVDEAGLAAMHGGFELNATLSFPLRPGEYHTNVLMSVLAGRVLVVNPDAIVDPAVMPVLASLYDGAIVELSDYETENFAGNCIALTNDHVFISARGADALTAANRARLEALGFQLVAVNVDEIEKSGGSVRCMIGEIF